MSAEEHDRSCQRNHKGVDSQRVLQIDGRSPKSEAKQEHGNNSKEVDGTIFRDFRTIINMDQPGLEESQIQISYEMSIQANRIRKKYDSSYYIVENFL